MYLLPWTPSNCSLKLWPKIKLSSLWAHFLRYFVTAMENWWTSLYFLSAICLPPETFEVLTDISSPSSFIFNKTFSHVYLSLNIFWWIYFYPSIYHLTLSSVVSLSIAFWLCSSHLLCSISVHSAVWIQRNHCKMKIQSCYCLALHHPSQASQSSTRFGLHHFFYLVFT